MNELNLKLDGYEKSIIMIEDYDYNWCNVKLEFKNNFKDYEVYYMGNSNGGIIGAQFGIKYPQIKRMLLINPPLMINWHRTKEGLNSAKRRGKVLGRPCKFQDKKETILNMYNSNDYSINDIITATGISKTSLYRLVNAQ